MGLRRVLELGTEHVGVRLVGHGRTGDVAQGAVEMLGHVFGIEACEHEAHEGLRCGRILNLEGFGQFLGGGVVLLRHLVRERDSDMDHSYLLG
jgi:hypothetical protein